MHNKSIFFVNKHNFFLESNLCFIKNPFEWMFNANSSKEEEEVKTKEQVHSATESLKNEMTDDRLRQLSKRAESLKTTDPYRDKNENNYLSSGSDINSKIYDSPDTTGGAFKNISTNLSNTIDHYNYSSGEYKNNFSALILEEGNSLGKIKSKFENGKGVLQADFKNKVVKNKNLIDWKNNLESKKTSKLDIKRLKKVLDKEILSLYEFKDSMHKYAFSMLDKFNSNEKKILNKSSLTLLKDFSNTSYNTEINPDKSFLPDKNNIQSNLLIIRKILSSNKINGIDITDNLLSYFERFKEVLLYSNQIHDANEEKLVLKNLEKGNLNPNWEHKKILLSKKIESYEIKINKFNSEEPKNIKLIESLKNKKSLAEKKLDIYKKYSDENSDLNPKEVLFNKFFDKDNKIKNPTNVISNLKDYHEWVKDSLFINGVPRPKNTKLELLLVSAVYKGEVSLKNFRNGLKNIVNIQVKDASKINIEYFYNELGKVMLGGKSKILDNGLIIKAFGNECVLEIKNAIRWSSKYKLSNQNIDVSPKIKLSDDVSFQNEWGFSMSQVYNLWKKEYNKPISPSSIDNHGNKMKNGNSLPIENWIDSNGQINNSPAMKNFLLSIIPASKNTDKKVYKLIMSKCWVGNEPELKNFVAILKDDFLRREKIFNNLHWTNSSIDSNEFIKSIKGSSGESVSEKLEYIADEVMDGNMIYWGIIAGFGYLWSKNEGWGDAIFAVAGAGLLNVAVDDLSGFNILDESLYMLKGNSKKQSKNPASWTMHEMKESKSLDNTEFSYDELERAGTCLGQANLKEVLDWYDEVNRKKSENNPDDKNIYKNEKLPSGLKKNLSFIFEGNNSINLENGEKPAKCAYEFITKYLANISLKYDPLLTTPSSELGYQHLRDNYVYKYLPEGHINKKNCLKTYNEEGGDQKVGYRLEEVFAQEINPKTIEKMTILNSPLLDYVSDLGNDVINFASISLANSFGTLEEATQKLKSIKDTISTWGWEMFEATGNEIKFRDNIGKVWKITKESDTWKVLGDGVSWVGDSFVGAWEWIKETVQDGSRLWNTFFLSKSFAKRNESAKTIEGTSNIDILSIVNDLGFIESIKNTYGIISVEQTENFLSIAQKNPSVQKSIETIAKVRLNKNPTDKLDVSEINNGDIIMYFFSGAYGIGTGVQTTNDIVETMAGLLNTVVKTGAGIFSDDAKAFFTDYDGTEMFLGNMRQHIDGSTNFVNFAHKTSLSSLKVGTDILLTETSIQEYLQNFLKQYFKLKDLKLHAPWIVRFWNNAFPSYPWDYLPNTKKQHILLFVKKELERYFADGSTRNEFFNQITKPLTTKKITLRLKDLIKEHVESYEFTI
jgi:hypothetical protein